MCSEIVDSVVQMVSQVVAVKFKNRNLCVVAKQLRAARRDGLFAHAEIGARRLYGT